MSDVSIILLKMVYDLWLLNAAFLSCNEYKLLGFMMLKLKKEDHTSSKTQFYQSAWKAPCWIEAAYYCINCMFALL